MKRLTLLAAALVMVLGFAVNASAAPEVSISGNILMNAVWSGNWDFNDDAATANQDAALEIYQRSDLYFTITANENLKGVLGFRSVRGEWGQGAAALGAPGGATGGVANWTIGIRDAFVEFAWPDTDVNVKAGVYTVALPQQVGGGSYILGDRAGAVTVTVPFTDTVSLLAGFTRLLDNNLTTASADDQSQADAWLAALPVNLEGFAFTPYILYAKIGRGDVALTPANEDGTAFWIGSDFSMNLFDPFIVKADLAFGKHESDDDTVKASGWLFDLGLDYTGWDFATLETYFVYTSGEDSDNDESERIVSLADDFALGGFFFGGGLVTGDDMGRNPGGFWLLGASLTGIQSFAEGLSHDAHIFYMGGTNDEDANAAAGFSQVVYGTDLKKGDGLIEIDFNTTYSLYDELTLYAGLGYINLDVDEDNWVAGQNGGDAWKVSTGVVYQF